MRGKPWLIEDERLLRQLVEEGKGFSDISQVIGKSRISVKNKLYNLGLSLKDNTQSQIPIVVSSSLLSSKTPTNNVAPAVDPVNDEIALELKTTAPLPRVEEKLRVLDAALVALEHPGLSPTEITRLTKIIDGVKVYEHLYEKFVNYSALEDEVIELRRQLASEKHKS